jgi:hypothetical protein
MNILIILGIILLLLIIFKHIKISINGDSNEKNENEKPPNCSKTTFGCCPDGVNSKINYIGTNCPSYRPEPGYPPRPIPYPVQPIGGCAGTIYGCCPNNITPKIDELGSNCIYIK